MFPDSPESGQKSMKYHVYVIELDREFADLRKAVEANPDRDPSRPCVYVGYTSKTPRQRFKQHMSGKPGRRGRRTHSTVVYKYGIKLLPELYRMFNPIPSRERAMEAEVMLANLLRVCGYTVWQN